MAILVDSSTRILVQGITGDFGSRHARASLDYGTLLVAGVTPGKGGQTFDHGSHKVPVFDTVGEAVRETGAAARVLNESIDEVAGAAGTYDVVTARAFAPLPRIISSAKPLFDRGAIGLFLKGAEYRAELAAAADEGWVLKAESLTSMSDPEGRILRIEGAERVGKDDKA